MKGSGLSLERFIKGKAHKTKAEAKSKKRAIVHKAVRKREYEKIKRRENGKQDQQAAASMSGKQGGGGGAATGSSFYDRFFSELTKEDDNDDAKGTSNKPSKEKEGRHMDIRPDPFYKAKKKAAIHKEERQRATREREQRHAQVEKKVTDRKKRHVKLSVRTTTGQPVVRNHIKDILSKLQADK